MLSQKRQYLDFLRKKVNSKNLIYLSLDPSFWGSYRSKTWNYEEQSQNSLSRFSLYGPILLYANNKGTEEPADLKCF